MDLEAQEREDRYKVPMARSSHSVPLSYKWPHLTQGKPISGFSGGVTFYLSA